MQIKLSDNEITKIIKAHLSALIPGEEIRVTYSSYLRFEAEVGEPEEEPQE